MGVTAGAAAAAVPTRGKSRRKCRNSGLAIRPWAGCLRCSPHKRKTNPCLLLKATATYCCVTSRRRNSETDFCCFHIILGVFCFCTINAVPSFFVFTGMQEYSKGLFLEKRTRICTTQKQNIGEQERPKPETILRFTNEDTENHCEYMTYLK